MSHVLIIGGGFSGCTVAYELAVAGVKATIIEKTARVGGKVRNYGCKATDKCNNCGVCLAGGLWEKVEKNENIDILPDSRLVDVTGKAGDFSVVIKSGETDRYINGIASIVVSTGFEQSASSSGHLQIEGMQGVIKGLEIEKLCKERTKDAFFEKAPERVAFIQCVGSRDKKEDSMYCSRVCCSYSTRAAKVIKQLYPQCLITFFYMEMQAVSGGDYFLSLKEDYGVEFIKCRPLRITGGERVFVEYDDPASGNLEKREFNVVCLSEGIHPGPDADIMAELCGLGQDKHGFLKAGAPGVYVAGCAKRPAKIEETWSDSVAVAKQIRREV